MARTTGNATAEIPGSNSEVYGAGDSTAPGDGTGSPQAGGVPLGGIRKTKQPGTATKLYRVLRPVQHDKDLYAVNNGIMLDDDDAADLLADGAIEVPVVAKPVVPSEPARLTPTPVAPVLTVPVAAVEVIAAPTA